MTRGVPPIPVAESGRRSEFAELSFSCLSAGPHFRACGTPFMRGTTGVIRRPRRPCSIPLSRWPRRLRVGARLDHFLPCFRGELRPRLAAGSRPRPCADTIGLIALRLHILWLGLGGCWTFHTCSTSCAIVCRDARHFDRAFLGAMCGAAAECRSTAWSTSWPIRCAFRIIQPHTQPCCAVWANFGSDGVPLWALVDTRLRVPDDRAIDY